MGKVGKISTIKKEYSSKQDTMQTNLAKKGLTRIPGTGVFKYPYKDHEGKYRTGLDPEAAYIQRIADPIEKEVEIKRVTELRKKLELALGLNLDPRSEYWNHAKSTSAEDNRHVRAVKLMDGDNIFDLSSPTRELEYSWLRVHPMIASSYQAWERGEYNAETQFFVSDDDIESAVLFKKKQFINKAIGKLDAMTPEKKRKVARIMGLPVSEDTKEGDVYNQIDNLLKQTEMKGGKYQGLNPVELFTRFADMKEQLLTVRDLVKQAIAHSVYRVKANGKVYRGDNEVARDEDELVKFLVDEDNQEDLIILEQELKTKKLASI